MITIVYKIMYNTCNVCIVNVHTIIVDYNIHTCIIWTLYTSLIVCLLVITYS